MSSSLSYASSINGSIFLFKVRQERFADVWVGRLRNGSVLPLTTRFLVHSDKQITQLKRRDGFTIQSRIPVRRLEKYSKFEEATLKWVQVDGDSQPP